VASVLEKYDPQELQCSVNILGAFHQVNLKRKSEVLNFAAADQNYAHIKLPKGGVNSVNILQAVLNGCFKTLGRCLHPWFLAYMDDIILTSKSVQEMKERLEEFLKLCQKHNIVLKKSKSNLLRKDDIALLGFTVSQ
jgi:histidinol phosphatase-like PHP family hydrolase